MTKTKKIILGIGIFVILFLLYAYLTKKPDTSSLPTGASETATQGDLVGQQFIALLNDLRTITFDNNFFANPAYQSLEKQSITIQPQPVGRSNPFASIGTDH